MNQDGTISGAARDFHEAQREDAPSVLDGNYFRGKAWSDIVRRGDAPRGPRQLAPRDRIDLRDRRAAIQEGVAGGARGGGGGPGQSRYGERVNLSTKERAYDIGGYEREVWIDPRRNITEVVGREGGGGGESAEELNASVMFETAGGLAAKINNGHLMGGERVKELDFFVASVETPSVVVRPPDPAEAVADAALATKVPLPLSGGISVSGVGGGGAGGGGAGGGGAGAVLHVQKELLSSSGGLPPGVDALANALRFLVHTCVTELLIGGGGGGGRLKVPLSRVRFTYFATMRADASVAKLSEKDGCVYFNVMVLQQQQCVDASRTPGGAAAQGGAVARDWGQWRRWMRRPGGDDDDDGEERVAVLQRRAWRYWLERTAAALGHGPPTGLYDAAVRARFKTFMEDRSAEERGREESQRRAV